MLVFKIEVKVASTIRILSIESLRSNILWIIKYNVIIYSLSYIFIVLFHGEFHIRSNIHTPCLFTSQDHLSIFPEKNKKKTHRSDKKSTFLVHIVIFSATQKPLLPFQKIYILNT